MLLCTGYSKEKCSTDCSYAKGEGIFTINGEKTSEIDNYWLEDTKKGVNFLYCGYNGHNKKEIIVISSLLEYYMKEIIKEHEEENGS